MFDQFCLIRVLDNSCFGGGFLACTSPVQALDIEYLISAILAGLYHSQRKFEAGGDQLVVSILSHLISQMSTSSSLYNWYQKNLYGTTAADKQSQGTGG